MNIQEAIKEAVEKDCCITLLNYAGEMEFKIKPERIEIGGFAKIEAFESCDKLYIDKWEPNYRELTSDKWVLTDNDLAPLKERLNKKWWAKIEARFIET